MPQNGTGRRGILRGFEKHSRTGLMGACLPEEYGGVEWTFSWTFSITHWFEEISRANAGVEDMLACTRARTRYPSSSSGTRSRRSGVSP